MTNDPDDLAGLRDEIDRVGKTAAKRFDPGSGAMLIAVAVLAILVSLILPWVGEDVGLQVLLGTAPALPKVFSYAVLVAGVILPAITLVARRWALAWVSALASFAASVNGVLSIWMTQTTTGHQPGPGPGAGLVIAVIAIIVLLVKWLKIAASRPALQ
ncbi:MULTISPECIES: Rv2732c family membrane protein [unclassified Saccharothrix]|uniref:Rv2732c family membrane protein n=1 Tax=unclassified Saccharothrix TaxID=2593673 RepID=UPI00307E1B40